ncbi:MAG: phenylalanyl-tRNA synthetase, alpha subunit [Chloroflexi bacterium]|nr:phenylalanyl-tRNA synthetase, alpha subunit [Chloroflexota bacterium]
MTGIDSKLKVLVDNGLKDLNHCSDEQAAETWHAKYLGRSGAIADLMRSIGQLDREDRPSAGQAANEAKATLEAAYLDRRGRLDESSLARRIEADRVDVTMPGRRLHDGGLHPITLTLRRILEIFRDMGFQVTEGPEVELDWYNFEALNIPAEHPARDMWDTFYVQPPSVLLRTHTSPNQARVMQRSKPPIRIVVPGRCYRYEAQDASHEWMFYQVEGLAVDAGLTMADLKGVLVAFAQRMFWPEVQCRFRCDYFPFVEPGMEMSVQCPICRGSGCRVCKMSGWIELLGAGMVHPQVLRNVGYDPDAVNGFAFGMGPERITMVKHAIDDIRLFYGNDLRFLKQFN